MAKGRSRLKRLGLAVATVVLMGGLICATDRILGLGLSNRLSQLCLLVLQPRLYEEDERLGWRHKPGAQTTRNESEYTATYTVGPDGDRIVPGAPNGGTTIAFLGCSFCFGLGVNDDEVFTSVLQRDYWKTCRVRNLGCIGYNTSHVLLRLEDEIRKGRRIDVAVYCWMWHHRFRNDRRKSWLRLLTALDPGKNPLHELERGKPVYKGLISLDQSLDDNDPTLAQREGRITYALLKAMYTLCQEHGIRFIVLLYPFPLESGPAGFERSDPQMVSDCQSLGIDYLDLTGYSALRDPAGYYPKDHHPRASWHRTVAKLVAEGVDPKTGRVHSPLPSTQVSK